MGYGYITCQEKTFSLSSECLTFPGPVEAQRPAFTNKAPSIIADARGFSVESGGYLLSHGCAVPSAQAGLTSLFGMGRGGTPPL